MNFIAIDIETANADMSSICQIGLAKYENGSLAGEWVTYVNPEDFFDDINVAVHGIGPSLVQSAPTFRSLSRELYSHLETNVVVCHTHFDRVALHQAAQKHGINVPKSIWLDSAQIARRTWKECAWKGYGLSSVCRMLGYEFRHHNALEDAKAAAHILLAASNETGYNIDDWLKRVRQPIDPTSSGYKSATSREGNPEGALFGEVLVFTGTLEITRREAADLAASSGCNVASGVTQKTSLLVVGDQDVKRLAGNEKSTKHRKAEELIAKGVPIRILRESDFRELVKLSKEMA